VLKKYLIKSLKKKEVYSILLIMKNKSFTLIELLVVIVIIGILAGVIIVSVSSSIDKANFAKAQSFSNTVQNELLGDLVSEWTFDNESKLGEDTWGNNDGTVSGATLETDCVYSSCVGFDGEDDYIDLGSSDTLSIRNKITISAWIKTEGSINEQAILFDTHSGGTIPIEFYINKTNNIVFASYDNGIIFVITSNTKIPLNTWIHVLVSFDKDLTTKAKKIYINGALDKTSDDQTILSTRNGTIRIGAYGTNWDFKGSIDDVRVYNRALSEEEITLLYNSYNPKIQL